MIDFDDPNEFEKVLSFELNEAFICEEGIADRGRREEIRSAADSAIQSSGVEIEPDRFLWWAFRIKVYKFGADYFDIDNVPKAYIDAFCDWYIKKDHSEYQYLALYKDDTIDCVKYLEIHGERVEHEGDERTLVEIFGKIAPPDAPASEYEGMQETEGRI